MKDVTWGYYKRIDIFLEHKEKNKKIITVAQDSKLPIVEKVIHYKRLNIVTYCKTLCQT